MSSKWGSKTGDFFHLSLGRQVNNCLKGRNIPETSWRRKTGLLGELGHCEAMPSSHVNSFKFLLVLFHAHPIKQGLRISVSLSSVKDHYGSCSFSVSCWYSNTVIQGKMGDA